MAIEIDTEDEERGLVENFRATGYGGSEPWVAALNPVIGTRVVAVRQLEACATYPACAWRDNDADEAGLWSFTRQCLLKPLLSFARIVEASIPSGDVCGDANADDHLVLAWRNVKRLLDRLANAEPSKASYPETAKYLLLAAMVLRQMVEADARGEVMDQRHFVPPSTNVHPTFLPCLFDKLGSAQFELSVPVRLTQLNCSLEA